MFKLRWSSLGSTVPITVVTHLTVLFVLSLIYSHGFLTATLALIITLVFLLILFILYFLWMRRKWNSVEAQSRPAVFADIITGTGPIRLAMLAVGQLAFIYAVVFFFARVRSLLEGTELEFVSSLIEYFPRLSRPQTLSLPFWPGVALLLVSALLSSVLVFVGALGWSDAEKRRRVNTIYQYFSGLLSISLPYVGFYLPRVSDSLVANGVWTYILLVYYSSHILTFAGALFLRMDGATVERVLRKNLNTLSYRDFTLRYFKLIRLPVWALLFVILCPLPQMAINCLAESHPLLLVIPVVALALQLIASDRLWRWIDSRSNPQWLFKGSSRR
ncbi:hypothetical protein CCYS_03975 [Corynebacterium cystitidis DSM 20524]|uniref:Uncharacterized protein n=1 Tax=Corynebacterium cystitidis DSM 20524 TaxID=1121357 RepID=A0A1H9QJT6_9CORY|nr:hypothetical protein CCYS_03975 [Corynebacterium cystitidis DSM 20524]SER60688.1 hypothetical protein SAMN05661109_00571 [Corynebacterium cystitidis DSM 20524]SNV84035.1 Uncharacterised protein [Corynebacterium cystitidis]